MKDIIDFTKFLLDGALITLITIVIFLVVLILAGVFLGLAWGALKAGIAGGLWVFN